MHQIEYPECMYPFFVGYKEPEAFITCPRCEVDFWTEESYEKHLERPCPLAACKPGNHHEPHGNCPGFNEEHPTWTRGWFITEGRDGTGSQAWWRESAFASGWRYGELANLRKQNDERFQAVFAMAMEDFASLVAAVTPEQDYRGIEEW